MPTFEIVCLANSRKRQGRCVAGLRTDGQGWLRPVGPNAEGVLHPHHYTLPDDTEPQLGDALRVHCSRPNPRPHHPEDWIVMPLHWERVSSASETNRREWLRPYLSPGPNLLGSAGDRVAYAQIQARPVAQSLSLVAPQTLQWHISVNKEGERRTRVVFTLDGAQYRLALTDPVWEARLLHLKPGLHERETARIVDDTEVWLTISLSEPFASTEQDEEYCYKLVAGVLVLTAAGIPQAKTANSGNGRASAPTSKLQREKRGTPAPAYASTPDLTLYLDPFAEDMPTAAVTEGRSTVSASAFSAELPPLPTAANMDVHPAPISPESATPLVSRQSRKRDRKSDKQPNSETDAKSEPKPNERANGKWDSKQDQLLWQRQMARTRHTNTVPALPWSEDEDALLQRLAADGETPEHIASQVGRPISAVSARLETFGQKQPTKE